MATCLSFLVGCETFRDTPDSENFIMLDPSETLYVKFTHVGDLRFEQSFPDLADTMKERRREQYYTLMRPLVQSFEFPMNVHLLKEFEQPGNGPLLELHAYRWQQERFGEVEVRLTAKLERYGDLNTLGSFSERESPLMGSSSTMVDEAFAKPMSRALTSVLNQLNTHIEMENAEDVFLEP